MGSMNKAYSTAQTRAAIIDAFFANKSLPSVALGDILTAEAFDAVKARARTGWRRTSTPDQYHHDVLAKPIPELHEVRRFAERIVGKKLLREKSRRFSHRDYTLMHDNMLDTPGALAYLFLDDWDDAWGGSIVLMKHGETLGKFTPKANTLLIVEKRSGVRSFVQYVNHRAGKRSFTILAV